MGGIEYIRDVPVVSADHGMVYLETTGGEERRWAMSPHMALVISGAMRGAAYEAMGTGNDVPYIGPVFRREDFREG